MSQTPAEDAREKRLVVVPEADAEAAAPPAWLARLPDTADETTLRRFFASRPALRAAATIETLCAETTRLLRVDLERAGRLAAAARWLADELDHDPSRARGLRAVANVRHFSGDSKEARELYRAALERFVGLGDEREAAITRSSALQNLAYHGAYREARRWAEDARATFERLGDRLRLAILDHNLGNILYRQDCWAEALERYQRANKEFLALARPRDAAICQRNIAVCHISLHRFGEALEVYRRTRAFCHRHGLARLALEIDYNIAYLYYQRGEYTRAIKLFEAARRQCEAEGDEYHQALCNLDQSEIFLELNMVSEAARLAQAAYASFARQKIPYEAAKALTNRAIALSRQGRGPRALELLATARGLFEDEKNRLWPALIDFYRAVVLHRSGRPDEAIRLARRARRRFAESALRSRAAMCELLLAEVLLDLDRPEEARGSCHRVLTRLEGLELPALEHQTHLILGRIEEALGHREAALDAYRRSHRWLERLSSQVQGEDLKIAFLQDKHVVYENLVWLTLRAGRDERSRRRAFGYVEKAKSRGLADLMAFRSHELPPRAEIRGDLAQRVQTLREELNWFYRRTDLGAAEPASNPGPRADVQRKEDELLRLLRELRTADRELSSLQTAAMVDLETFRSTLPPETTVVEYYIARGTVLVAVVDRERLEIETLTTATRARELHRLLQFQLSKAALGTAGAAPPELIAAATGAHLRQLYRELIAPIRRHLRGRHLIIVPHGFLHYLPFHALHDGEDYLIDRFSISYAPSASVFHLCSTKRPARATGSLVLGVADPRAPHILEEARAVAEALPDARLLLAEAASEEALRRYGAECRYLHLATHGHFRRDNPMFSAIQLGTSRLNLFDLYELRLDAELVVLSGCGTGLNAVLGAEELVGLTRGLLYAGARSALVTLWDVNDASTAAFMRRFYRHLARGAGRAPALRGAMQDLRRDYPAPYYWAPFVLVGDPAGS